MTFSFKIASMAALLGGAAEAGYSQAAVVAGTFAPGSQVLFATDFSQDPIGSFPASLKYVSGSLEVVTVNGVPMLRASSPSQFVIPLAGRLPQDFTLEFELIARDGAGYQVAFEGGPVRGVGPASALVGWSKNGVSVEEGGIGRSEIRFSADVEAELIGQRVSVQVMMTGTQFKLFTNGRQNFNIPNLAFRRAAALRIEVGGNDGAAAAVYLAKIQLATGPALPVAAAGSQSSGSTGIINPPPTVTATGTQQPATPATPTVPTRPGATTGVTRTGTSTTLAPPTALTVSGSPTRATLSWQPPAGWAPTGYLVHRADQAKSTPVQLTASPLPASATTYDDASGFLAGLAYDYILTALSPNPTAAGTARVSFQPPAPANVTNLAARQTGADVTVSWTPVPMASEYVVTGPTAALSRSVQGASLCAQPNCPAGSPTQAPPTSVTFNGVAPGTYRWTVAARYQPGGIAAPPATWPAVSVTVLDPNPVVVEGRFYREVSRPEVYYLLDGNKIHVPTPDALRLMGTTMTGVTDVVDGALNNWKLYTFASGSPTPGSLLFPPLPPAYAPLRLAGSTRIMTRGLESFVGELRGWLWWKSKVDGCDDEGDIKYGLEVDTEWALAQGIDLHQLYWVGNLGPSGGGVWEPGSLPRASVLRPMIALELNAFTWKNVLSIDNLLAPADWNRPDRSTERACAQGTRLFPFNPDLPAVNIDLVPFDDQVKGRGPYVRVVGTLLTDNPHAYTLSDLSTWLAYNFKTLPATVASEWNAAVVDWHPGVDPLTDPTHRARWTEIHPPDLIEPITPPARTSTMKAIGLVARPSECQAAVLTVAPDDTATSSFKTLAWEEIRGPETFFPAGQNSVNGSWVNVVGNAIVVNASVCGGPSQAGRFKAFYRVWWK
ncbi:MAG: hypothetical protein SFV24_18740 [Gemmatimonadales bacterium]|nr:hypothetical protein [Gemmatimonadales bacterium]